MAVTCPTCGKPAESKHSPFCSSRCAHADLGRWLSGQYAVPAEENPIAVISKPLRRPSSKQRRKARWFPGGSAAISNFLTTFTVRLLGLDRGGEMG